MATKVVNCRYSYYDVFIGRMQARNIGEEAMHYGNPFSHLTNSLAEVILPSKLDCITAYEEWLLGFKWQKIQIRRRAWILSRLDWLKDKTLGCFCYPGPCHGDVLVSLVDQI